MKRILATATTNLFPIRYPFRIRESKAVCSFDVKYGSHKKPISRKKIVSVYGLKAVYSTPQLYRKRPHRCITPSLVIILFIFTINNHFAVLRSSSRPADLVVVFTLETYASRQFACYIIIVYSKIVIFIYF